MPAPDLSAVGDDLPEGGCGIAVVRQLADELSYTSGTPAGDHWRLVKRLPPEPAGAYPAEARGT